VIVVADTGPLYALVDRSDAWHRRVVDWWTSNRATVVIPAEVLPEVCYLLQRRIGADAEAAFVEAVAHGEFTIEPLEREDLSRVAELTRKYIDMPLGFVDATVIAAAERLETREILTTDRKHFSAVKPGHARSFALHP
jgi:predicted nucleic acid-binding protein